MGDRRAEDRTLGDRRAELTAAVRARLARVCAQWAPDDFAAFVETTVDRALRHEARLATLLPKSPDTQ